MTGTEEARVAAIVAELEARRPDLVGKRTRDVADLADWRVAFRDGYYRYATLNFVGALMNLVVLSWEDGGFLQWLQTACFSASFLGMFFSEFRARGLSRQLNRPVAEQLARDVLGLRG